MALFLYNAPSSHNAATNTSKAIVAANARHVLHDLVREARTTDITTKDTTPLRHLLLHNVAQANRQVDRILVHDPPEEPALEGSI